MGDSTTVPVFHTPCPPQQMPFKLPKLKVTRGRSFSSLRCQAKRLCPTLVVILKLQAVGSTKGNHLLVEDGIEYTQRNDFTRSDSAIADRF